MSEKISLLNLKIEGFRSFKNETVIDFSNFGLTLVSGLDERTGGSNGSGKSSIFEAIAYVLNINSLPATELKNWDSKKMSVTLSLQVENDIWEINRSPNHLSLKINETPIDGLKSFLEEKITQTVGQKEILEALVYRRQDEGGFLIGNQDSKLKAFLCQCFPELLKAESLIEKASEDTKDLERRIESLKASCENTNNLVNFQENQLKGQDIESLKKSNEELQDRLDKITYPDLDLSDIENEIAQLKNRKRENEQILDKATVDISSDPEYLVIQEQKAQKEQSAKAIQESLGSLSAQIKITEEYISNVQSQISNLYKTQVQLDQKKQAASALLKEMKHLSEAKCPECLRNWDESLVKLQSKKIEAANIAKEIKSLSDELNLLPDLNFKLTEFRKNLESLRSSQSTESSRFNSLVVEISDLDNQVKILHNNKLSNAQKQFLEVIADLKTQISLKENELSNKRSNFGREVTEIDISKRNIESMMSNNMSVINSHEESKRKLAELQAQYEKQLKEINDLEEKRKLESSVSEVLKDVINNFFEEMLFEVEYETNNYLTQIPNSSDLSIQIQTKETLKNGNTRARISTVVKKGSNDISIKSLSGGQRSSLSLCSDLALISAVRKRTNIRTNWIALDEFFDGMDLKSKEAATEILKRYSEDMLVLVVDHATELKESFDTHINVVYDGFSSRIG